MLKQVLCSACRGEGLAKNLNVSFHLHDLLLESGADRGRGRDTTQKKGGGGSKKDPGAKS